MKRTKREKKGEVKKNEKRSAPLKKTDNKRLILAIIGAVTTFFASIFFIPDNAEINLLGLKLIYFYFISIFAASVIFYGANHRNKTLAENVTKYSFLVLIIFSIIVSIIPVEENTPSFIAFHQKLLIFQSFVIFPAIVVGLMAIYQNRLKLNVIINNLFTEDSKKEFFFEPVKKLFSKNEVLSTSVLFVIIGISIFTLFYRLDYFDLYSDEAAVVEGATGYYHDGVFQQWDFVKDRVKGRVYNRAWPHLWLVAQAYKIFGITPWAGRFVSVLFGIFTLLLVYPIARFFTGNKTVALLALLPFVFYYDFLLLLRWTRMYAVLIPVYISLAYISYRMITEKNTVKFINLDKITKLKPFVDFNYAMLPIFLFLTYLSYNLHLTSLFIFISIPLFAIAMLVLTKEKKYLTIIILSAIISPLLLLNPFFQSILIRFTFFESNNAVIYSHFLAGFPFSWKTNVIIIIVSLFSLFLSKNKEALKKSLYLFISIFILWIMFSFIFKYSVSFRYISFAVPLAIILIFATWAISFKTIFNKYINIVIVILVVISSVWHFKSIYPKIYVYNWISPGRPSIAFQDIVRYHKKDQLIYRHWSPIYYIDDIDTTIDVKVISKNFSTAIKTMKEYPSGWLTWKTQHTNLINENLKTFAELYFKKYRGKGIGKTGVELYYFDLNKFKDTTDFIKEKVLPHANLNLARTLSFSFTYQITPNNTMVPFYAFNDKDTLFYLSQDILTKEALIIYKQDTIVYDREGILYEGKHNIFITVNEKTQKLKAYINVKKTVEKQISVDADELVKFKINPYFTGYINDIRIYDFELNADQMKVIIQNIGNPNSSKLFVNNEAFENMFYWNKR